MWRAQGIRVADNGEGNEWEGTVSRSASLSLSIEMSGKVNLDNLSFPIPRSQYVSLHHKEARTILSRHPLAPFHWIVELTMGRHFRLRCSLTDKVSNVNSIGVSRGVRPRTRPYLVV